MANGKRPKELNWTDDVEIPNLEQEVDVTLSKAHVKSANSISTPRKERAYGLEGNNRNVDGSKRSQTTKPSGGGTVKNGGVSSGLAQRRAGGAPKQPFFQGATVRKERDETEYGRLGQVVAASSLRSGDHARGAGQGRGDASKKTTDSVERRSNTGRRCQRRSSSGPRQANGAPAAKITPGSSLSSMNKPKQENASVSDGGTRGGKPPATAFARETKRRREEAQQEKASERWGGEVERQEGDLLPCRQTSETVDTLPPKNLSRRATSETYRIPLKGDVRTRPGAGGAATFCRQDRDMDFNVGSPFEKGRKKPMASSPEVLTIEDGSCDEDKDESAAVGRRLSLGGANVGDGGCGGDAKSSANWESNADGIDGQEATRSRQDQFGSIPEFDGEAVMVGTWVVPGKSHLKISGKGDITITLPTNEEAGVDQLKIPYSDITFFGFCQGIERRARPLIAIRTAEQGIIANQCAYSRNYDPVDKGAAGLITVFLNQNHNFDAHEAAVRSFVNVSSVDMDMKGELPHILKRTLDEHIAEEKRDAKEPGAKQTTRRTLRSGAARKETRQVILHYPPEASASDRVAISAFDEARTREGEFLNDSLIDLFLKHMHREAFRTWKRPEVADAMDDKRVYIFTSHFFTKLRESPIDDFEAAYSGVQNWGRSVDIFSKKFVFVPVVENMHWSLACFANLDKLQADKVKNGYADDEEQPCLLFLDSLDMHYASRIYNYLSRYIEQKWKELRKEPILLGRLSFPLVKPRVPIQINGCDCGVYVLRFAKEICQQWPRVTAAQAKDRLKAHFQPDSFSPKDIDDERAKLRQLLDECKVRYEQEKQKPKPGPTREIKSSSSDSEVPKEAKPARAEDEKRPDPVSTSDEPTRTPSPVPTAVATPPLTASPVRGTHACYRKSAAAGAEMDVGGEPAADASPSAGLERGENGGDVSWNAALLDGAAAGAIAGETHLGDVIGASAGGVSVRSDGEDTVSDEGERRNRIGRRREQREASAATANAENAGGTLAVAGEDHDGVSEGREREAKVLVDRAIAPAPAGDVARPVGEGNDTDQGTGWTADAAALAAPDVSSAEEDSDSSTIPEDAQPASVSGQHIGDAPRVDSGENAGQQQLRPPRPAERMSQSVRRIRKAGACASARVLTAEGALEDDASAAEGHRRASCTEVERSEMQGSAAKRHAPLEIAPIRRRKKQEGDDGSGKRRCLRAGAVRLDERTKPPSTVEGHPTEKEKLLESDQGGGDGGVAESGLAHEGGQLASVADALLEPLLPSSDSAASGARSPKRSHADACLDAGQHQRQVQSNPPVTIETEDVEAVAVMPSTAQGEAENAVAIRGARSTEQFVVGKDTNADADSANDAISPAFTRKPRRRRRLVSSDEEDDNDECMSIAECESKAEPSAHESLENNRAKSNSDSDFSYCYESLSQPFLGSVAERMKTRARRTYSSVVSTAPASGASVPESTRRQCKQGKLPYSPRRRSAEVCSWSSHPWQEADVMSPTKSTMFAGGSSLSKDERSTRPRNDSSNGAAAASAAFTSSVPSESAAGESAEANESMEKADARVQSALADEVQIVEPPAASKNVPITNSGGMSSRGVAEGFAGGSKSGPEAKREDTSRREARSTRRTLGEQNRAFLSSSSQSDLDISDDGDSAWSGSDD